MAQRLSKREATQLEVALQSRDVELGPKLYDGMYNGKVEFRDGGLWYPVLFLYDEMMQSDFVASASEKTCLDDHFCVMFPDGRNAEWDERGIYKNGRLVAFLEVLSDEKRNVPDWEKPDPEDERPTKMLPLPVTTTLQDAVKGKTLPGMIVVHVFVMKTAALREFKERFLRS